MHVATISALHYLGILTEANQECELQMLSSSLTDKLYVRAI